MQNSFTRFKPTFEVIFTFSFKLKSNEKFDQNAREKKTKINGDLVFGLCDHRRRQVTRFRFNVVRETFSTGNENRIKGQNSSLRGRT